MRIDYIKSHFDKLVQQNYFGKELFSSPLKHIKANKAINYKAPHNNYNQITKFGLSLSPNRNAFTTNDKIIKTDRLIPAGFVNNTKKIRNPYETLKKDFSKKLALINEKSYLTKNSEISLLNLELDNIENKSNKKTKFELKLKEKLQSRVNDIKPNQNLNSMGRIENLKINKSCEVIDLNGVVYFPAIKSTNIETSSKKYSIKNMSFNKKIIEWKNLKEKRKNDFYTGKLVTIQEIRNMNFF